MNSSMRTRVKICGITNEEDLYCAASAGADAVGFNLYESSPRYIAPESAERLLSKVPAFVTTVGLFVNHTAEDVSLACTQAPFDILQFQGDEDDDFCGRFGRPFIKTIRVDEGTDIEAEAKRFPSCAALLLDAKVEGAYGGTGKTFDWCGVPSLSRPIILAGGLNADNVEQAIDLVRPWAVDVASGIEAAPGRKDHDRIEAFIAAVERADGNRNSHD